MFFIDWIYIIIQNYDTKKQKHISEIEGKTTNKKLQIHVCNRNEGEKKSYYECTRLIRNTCHYRNKPRKYWPLVLGLSSASPPFFDHPWTFYHVWQMHLQNYLFEAIHLMEVPCKILVEWFVLLFLYIQRFSVTRLSTMWMMHSFERIWQSKSLTLQ